MNWRLRLLRWAASRKTRIGLAMVATLLLVVGLDIVSILSPGLIPAVIRQQTDLSGSMNVAAALAACAGLAASGMAILKGSECRGSDRLAWFTVGAGCAGFALIDLLLDGRGGAWFALPMGVVAGALFLAIHWLVRPNTRAVVLLLMAFLLAASNPVFDAYEREIAGDPGNYRFVSGHDHYELTGSAWRMLDLVRQAQEGTELLVITILLGVFLMDRDDGELSVSL